MRLRTGVWCEVLGCGLGVRFRGGGGGCGDELGGEVSGGAEG